MRQRILWAGAVAAIAALVTGGCGSESPSGPSGAGGVVVQGVVLGGGTSSVAAADTQTSAAQAKKIKVRVDGTSLTVDVSANGTFQLTGVPSGSFTLVFLADGVEIGRVVITAEDGSEVKIVVQVTDSVLVLVELKVESPESQNGTSSSSCIINGGKAGSGIELEGNVASGSWQSFNLTATGRSSVPVVVTASTATFKCIGNAKTTSDAECKASVKTASKVHVRGTLPSCATAAVTAIEVKVQK